MSAFFVEDLRERYWTEGILKVPTDRFPALPSPEQIRALADDIVCLSQSGKEVANRIDSSMELIRVAINGRHPSDPDCVIERRQVLTRLENFITSHAGWQELCETGGIISEIVGLVCSEEPCGVAETDNQKWCLYKEKLNLKPAGGAGFAPHFDNPSLQVTGLCNNFITVMIAIDDMTRENGCLRVVRGSWSVNNATSMCSAADVGDDSDPDGNGRQGAMLPEAALKLKWEDLECQSGDVYIFSGWIPHRSGVNETQHARRAVFLTYNAPDDGDLRDDYYRVMRIWRAKYQSMSRCLS